jgi:hypothetical protein
LLAPPHRLGDTYARVVAGSLVAALWVGSRLVPVLDAQVLTPRHFHVDDGTVLLHEKRNAHGRRVKAHHLRGAVVAGVRFPLGGAVIGKLVVLLAANLALLGSQNAQ